jgi:allantoicase
LHFTELVDLASARLGGAVLSANDEFFADKENLLKEGDAVFLPERYTDRGKWMDGWESRRRRTPGHDFCTVRLGVPGVIRGVDVDTSHFLGNFPAACSLEAALAPEDAAPEAIAPWVEILPRTALRGGAHNLFPVFDRRRFTHVRLHIHPDGGVARLRVHGDVAADWARLASSGAAADLCALENGGLVLAASDSFFGSSQKLLMPGRPSGMHDGWETRRSRRTGYDWAIVRLGTRGVVEQVEVDTSHFKGNFPDLCAIETCDAPGAELESLTDASGAWRPLLPETKLRADTGHVFEKELAVPAAATHARLRIFPDGGVGRLRLFGRAEPPPALASLNGATGDEAAVALLRCCGSRAWGSRVADARPFGGHLDLFAAAEEALDEMRSDDWLEAFAAHPRIGERTPFAENLASTRSWAEREQAGALAAGEKVLDELAKRNREYEERFGFVFIVCATGRTGEQMLASLLERLANPRDVELSFAADEQRKITRLRIRKMLS